MGSKGYPLRGPHNEGLLNEDTDLRKGPGIEEQSTGQHGLTPSISFHGYITIRRGGH